VGNLILALAAIALLGVIAYQYERCRWNNGVCPCGKGFWKSFDMDSSGATGYHCTDYGCNRHIWISWFDPRSSR
jgi:hypothetical protein